MKRLVLVFCLVAACLLLPTELFSQVDNLSNMSTDWIRFANRNGATDAADIVIYNPAGLTKLADGFHINLGNQTLIRKPEHTFDLGMGMGEETYRQDGIDAILPNLYLAYKKNNWCIFGGVYIPGGGAIASYPNGSITTKLLGFGAVSMAQGIYNFFMDDSLEASSIYLTTTIGGAYAISDTISVSAAMRYINAKNTVEGELTLVNTMVSGIPPTLLNLEADLKADGVGGIFGLNISPGDKLNIGIRYETLVKLDFEATVKTDSFGGMVLVDGEKSRRDFPGMVGIGFSYQFTPKFRGEVDFNYYFQQQADWDSVFTLSGLKEYSDLVGKCYSFGACMAYKTTPKLELSCGFLYTLLDFEDMDAYYTNLGSFEVLHSHNMFIASGLSYKTSDSLRLTLGGGIILWKNGPVKALAAYPMDLVVDTKNLSFGLSVGLNILL
ncbi:MAG: hypothetical protein GY757_00210 [bacterium]|nr:hypothetical protein [bacterium]